MTVCEIDNDKDSYHDGGEKGDKEDAHEQVSNAAVVEMGGFTPGCAGVRLALRFVHHGSLGI